MLTAMTSRTSVWTPRRTHKLWPLSPGDKISARKLTFKPDVKSEWHMPPMPSWGKKKVSGREEAFITVDMLRARAAELREEADGLSGNAPAPGLKVQLGQILLQMDAKAFEAMLKKWDQKGRGEFLKAEMRLNLRNTGLSVTSAESDALFDSWDEDGGGSLDLGELRSALAKTTKEANAFNNKPDPAQLQIQKLQRRAALADDAAEATAHADAVEAELEALSRDLETRADVRLGALLQKRMIKPGEFVVRFSKASGANAGELSKADFRRAVFKLFEGKAAGSSGGSSRGAGSNRAGEAGLSPQKEEMKPTSAQEVDAVFDQFDDDGGGSMDVDEAKTMIKGLQAAGREAEAEKRSKEREAKAARARAVKKAAVAMAEPGSSPSAGSPQTEGSHAQREGVTRLFETELDPMEA